LIIGEFLRLHKTSLAPGFQERDLEELAKESSLWYTRTLVKVALFNSIVVDPMHHLFPLDH